MSLEAKLASLNIVLPECPKPVANYVPVVRAGDLLFLSGMIPLHEGRPTLTGTVGTELTVEQAYEAARVCAINALAAVRQETGSLDQVRRIVRLVGYVASGPGFVQQPAVVNGASDLLVAVFGEAGRHARVAVGAAALPLNAPVEIELIVQLRTSSSP